MLEDRLNTVFLIGFCDEFTVPRSPEGGAQVVAFSNNIRPASAVDKCEVRN